MLTRNEWLELRRTGIGGSDAAAILGLNPYESPYSIWADKLGLLPPKEENLAMELGKRFEQVVADLFVERTGKKVRRRNKMFRHPDYPFMVANIDRDIIGQFAGLECKTTDTLNTKKFKDGDFPETYYCQCVHYMTVMRYARWYLAVLIGNKQFLIYQLTRIVDDEKPEWCESSVYVSKDEIDALIKAESDFWQLVETQTPPEIDGSDATKKAIEAVNGVNEEEEPADLTGKENLVFQMDYWKEQRKEADQNARKFENQIREALHGATKGVMDGREVILQTIQKQPYMCNPKPYTQLRVKEVK